MIKIKCVLVTEDNGETFYIARTDYVTSDVNPKTGRGFRFGKMDFIDGEEILGKLAEKLEKKE